MPADSTPPSRAGRLFGLLRPGPRHRVAWWLLVTSYVFGAVMLAHGVHPSFVYLTAPHLVFSAGLLLSAHRPRPSARLWVWAGLCLAVGWLAEYVGVHGGWLFGSYVYGDVLGPKLRAVPLVIGVNWILVVYAVCNSLALGARAWPRWAKVLAAAAALVALDFVIEPVAIALDFWTWDGGAPPLQNYIGWALVGLAQAGLYFGLLPFAENRLAPVLLVLQVAFFAYLNFFLTA